MKYIVPLLLIASILVTACNSKSETDPSTKDTNSNHHSHEGPHGGELIELGAHVAHMEVLHDHDAASITLHSYDPDLKPLTLDQAPVLNFITDSGAKQITGISPPNASTEWTFKDQAFKGVPNSARFRIVLKGVTYSPDVPHHH